MTHPMQRIGVRIPPRVLFDRLHAAFAQFDPPYDDDPFRDPIPYRRAIRQIVADRFGIPTPEGLHDLIDEAGRMGVEPDALVQFFANQFRLKPLRGFERHRKTA